MGNGAYECPYNVHLTCEMKKCAVCGWNPEVETIRKEQLRILFSFPCTSEGYLRHLKIKKRTMIDE